MSWEYSPRVRKILLAGDSWSQGEFARVNASDSNPGGEGFCQLTHPGISHYLHSAYEDLWLCNVGDTGLSNNESFDRLITNVHPNDEYDAVLYFYTCPMRCFCDQHLQVKQYPADISIEEIIGEADMFAKRIFERLNELPWPVLLIGGHVDVPEYLLDEGNYPNLHVACSSMKNLGLPDRELVYYDWATIPRGLDWIVPDKKFPFSGRVQLELERKAVYYNTQWMENYMLFPDGGHAGRMLHQKLAYECVIPKLKQMYPEKY